MRLRTWAITAAARARALRLDRHLEMLSEADGQIAHCSGAICWCVAQAIEDDQVDVCAAVHRSISTLSGFKDTVDGDPTSHTASIDPEGIGLPSTTAIITLRDDRSDDIQEGRSLRAIAERRTGSSAKS